MKTQSCSFSDSCSEPELISSRQSSRAILHLLRHSRGQDVFLLTSAPPFLPIVGYLAHLCFRVSYVCLIYDIYPDIVIALNVIPNNHWLARFWQEVNKKVWRKAKGIVVLSPAMKQQVLVTCPEVADKVSVIHSWGDPELIVPIAKKDNWFVRKYNLDNKFTVLYSGNMGRCHDMNTIKCDRQLAENLGRASRQYLQLHFTPKIIAKQYLKVLRQAIDMKSA